MDASSFLFRSKSYFIWPWCTSFEKHVQLLTTPDRIRLDCPDSLVNSRTYLPILPTPTFRTRIIWHTYFQVWEGEMVATWQTDSHLCVVPHGQVQLDNHHKVQIECLKRFNCCCWGNPDTSSKLDSVYNTLLTGIFQAIVWRVSAVNFTVHGVDSRTNNFVHCCCGISSACCCHDSSSGGCTLE